MDRKNGDWRKASYSNGSGDCVEVGQPAAREVAVRDTKNRAGAVLHLTPEVWQRFAAQVKRS
jgi:Domain of unknown function (DUF397)